jgi:hypothetical protein
MTTCLYLTTAMEPVVIMKLQYAVHNIEEIIFLIHYYISLNNSEIIYKWSSKEDKKQITNNKGQISKNYVCRQISTRTLTFQLCHFWKSHILGETKTCTVKYTTRHRINNACQASVILVTLHSVPNMFRAFFNSFTVNFLLDQNAWVG